MRGFLLLFPLLLLSGCFAASRSVWTGRIHLQELEASPALAPGTADVAMTADGGKTFVRIREPIAIWTIPFRVLATPFAVIVDIIAPFVGELE